MLHKQTLLLAMLVPALALVSACNRHDADDATPAPAAPDTAMAPAPAAADTAMAPAANSAMAPAGAETPFADMDKNHDGFLTKDELPAGEMLADHFAKADTNGDGKLSEAEAAKHRADMAATAKP